MAVISAVCGVALGLLPGNAGADTIMKVTYSGEVTSLNDTTGVFGTPGTGLTADYVDQYVFDLSLGQRFVCCGFDELYGGSNFGLTSPLVDSKLTIDGHTLDFPGGSGDQQFNQFGDYAESYSNQFGPVSWLFNFQHMFTTAAGPIDMPFSGTGTGYGNFFDCPDIALCNADLALVSGNFNPTSITTSTPAPEPETWTLIVAGLVLAAWARKTTRSARSAST